MPTIQDVAKRAGVAPITVSRVINNAGYISEVTRQKVEAAIAELEYVPNSLARGLRVKQTKTIALVLTDITNPFFTVLARGVEDIANRAGFHVFLCNTDESESKQDDYLKALLQRQVDGFLLVPARSTTIPIRLLRKHNTAVVVLDRRVLSAPVDVVRCDSENGAFGLTRYLLDLGHRRIAALSGPQGVSTAVDRVAGYQRALAEHGLKANDHLIHFGQFTHESGYEMTRKVLQSQPCPTALFAANNFIAMGAICALREAQLRVPEEVSLVAFDDLPPNLVLHPFLTVAAQPSYEMGKLAADLLLARLSGEQSGDFCEIVLPTQLIIRTSTAAPA